MRATLAIMEMHMRKRPHLVILREPVASMQTPSMAQSKATGNSFAPTMVYGAASRPTSKDRRGTVIHAAG